MNIPGTITAAHIWLLLAFGAALAQPPADSLPAGRIYDVKSGIVEFKSSLGTEIRQMIYFDDYGAKQALLTSTMIDSTETVNILITAGGYATNYDLPRKTGYRKRQTPDALPYISQMSDSAKKALKLRKIADKTVLGKRCQGYSAESGVWKMKFWLYKGFQLKMETIINGRPISSEATSFQENAEIPAGKFIVPPDVRIKDRTK